MLKRLASGGVVKAYEVGFSYSSFCDAMLPAHLDLLIRRLAAFKAPKDSWR